MSPLTRRPVALFVFALSAAALAAAADPPPADKLRAAEATFREVYGKDYDKVMRGRTTGAEKAALGKKLWDAAQGSADNPALVAVLTDKALAAATADPAGAGLVLDIRRGRLTGGKDRPEQLAALAATLDRMARADKSAARFKIGADVVALYREAAEFCRDHDREADVGGYTSKAVAAAKALLPPAQAATVAKEVAAEQADDEADRRAAGEVKRLADQLRAKPDDPKANQGMALILLRSGQAAAAAPYLKASGVDRLRELGDALAPGPAVNPVKGGDLLRTMAADAPADKTALLGLARQQYESALTIDPNFSDAARVRLLIKELPPFRPGGVRASAPGSVIELVDEDNDAAERGWVGGKKSFDWSSREHYTGAKSARFTAGKRGASVAQILTFNEAPAAGMYRYVRFAVKQTRGDRLAVTFQSPGPEFVTYVFGKANPGERCIVLADRPPAEWAAISRDIPADSRGPQFGVLSVHVETDGEAWVDAMYAGRTARDLSRAVPKPTAVDKK